MGIEKNLNFYYSGNMEINTYSSSSTLSDAVQMLAALAQEIRLSIFRLLVQTGPEGLPAGQIAQTLSIAASTLSFHLAHLSKAGLIKAHSSGRQIIYSPNFSRMQLLTDYLLENCCQGKACTATAPKNGFPSPSSTQSKKRPLKTC